MACCSMFAALLFLFAVANGEIHFSETFPDKSSIDSWIGSTYNGDNQGKFEISAGNSPADEVAGLGLMTMDDAKFYGISKKIETPFSTEGKDFVVQYTVKYDKHVTCGGSYMKLLGSGMDQKKFHGETPYKVMFGPDICGYSTKKVHAIFNYKGKNILIKKDVPCKDDSLTHLYTFVIRRNCTYAILIDNAVVGEGAVEDDWDMLAPKMIDDPEAKKPEDWVDDEYIDDPESKKPDDWDQPEKIPDPNAKKPDDWDDDMDGEWERPQINNPDYKGKWEPKQISNPAYKGRWVAPQIPNPDYHPDEKLCALDDVSYVGFDLWQVDSQSIFDNILLTDDAEFAHAEGERLWRGRHSAEKKADEKRKDEERKKHEEDAKKAEEEEVSKKAEEEEVSKETEEKEKDSDEDTSKDDSKEKHEEL